MKAFSPSSQLFDYFLGDRSRPSFNTPIMTGGPLLDSYFTMAFPCRTSNPWMSMDWFVWEHLNRKSWIFPWKIWGFPKSIFPWTNPLRMWKHRDIRHVDFLKGFHLGVSWVMGLPLYRWMVYLWWKIPLKLDDDWGYPYFRKPPYPWNTIQAVRFRLILMWWPRSTSQESQQDE